MPGYNVKDRVNVSIFFNEQEFPLRQNVIGHIHMVESTRIYLPQLSIQLTDATKFLIKNNLLQDGTVIKINLGLGKEKKTYTFRLFQHQEVTTSASPTYRIHGYADCSVYWNQSLFGPQKGTTNSLLQKIANDSGMPSYSGTPTADNQTWFPQNKTYKEFARYLSEYGYVDDSSCMQLGVTLDKELRYRNVSLFKEAVVKEEFVTGKTSASDKNVIVDYKVINKAGFYNSISGYADTRVQQSSMAETKTDSQIAVPKNSTSLMMNAGIQGATTQGAVRFAPVDVGNTHDNYSRALYQNRRLANLFTFGIEVLVNNGTDAHILDVVRTAVTAPGITSLEAFSGEYLVVSKIIYVRGLDYFEKFELMRHGLNQVSNPSTNQVS